MNTAEEKKVNLWLIPTADIDHVWKYASTLLQKAIDRNPGEHTTETIYQNLIDGKYQLWTGYYMGKIIYAGVSRIVTYPTGDSSCELMYLGGTHMQYWLDHLPIVEKWAQHNGCKKVDIYGREGWYRMLDGYTKKFVVLTKHLGE